MSTRGGGYLIGYMSCFLIAVVFAFVSTRSAEAATETNGLKGRAQSAIKRN
jgi:hypothetical protein